MFSSARPSNRSRKQSHSSLLVREFSSPTGSGHGVLGSQTRQHGRPHQRGDAIAVQQHHRVLRRGQRRTKILNAVATNASVREIGDECGMVSGSPYHHFPAKDAIGDSTGIASPSGVQNVRIRP
jgi:hypothetical protein